MDDNDPYLLGINKDNLTRVIGFSTTYDSKANFALTIILALSAYLIAELRPISTPTPNIRRTPVCLDGSCGHWVPRFIS